MVMKAAKEKKSTHSAEIHQICLEIPKLNNFWSGYKTTTIGDTSLSLYQSPYALCIPIDFNFIIICYENQVAD